MRKLLDINVIADNIEIVKIIKDKENEIENTVKSIKEKIQISLSGFLNSHIHMTINRQYSSQQRRYELLIYDHLYRHYKSVQHFEKQKAIKKGESQ